MEAPEWLCGLKQRTEAEGLHGSGLVGVPPELVAGGKPFRAGRHEVRGRGLGSCKLSTGTKRGPRKTCMPVQEQEHLPGPPGKRAVRITGEERKLLGCPDVRRIREG